MTIKQLLAALAVGGAALVVLIQRAPAGRLATSKSSIDLARQKSLKHSGAVTRTVKKSKSTAAPIVRRHQPLFKIDRA